MLSNALLSNALLSNALLSNALLSDAGWTKRDREFWSYRSKSH